MHHATLSLAALLVASCLVGLNVNRWRTGAVEGRWALPHEPARANVDSVSEGLREQLTSVVGAVQAVGAGVRGAAEDHHEGHDWQEHHGDLPTPLAPKQHPRDEQLPSFTGLFRRSRKAAQDGGSGTWRDAPRQSFEASDVAARLVNALAAVQQLGAKWSENVTFAINTVDKLKYQLDNLEPMEHALSRPQWNPPRLMDGPAPSPTHQQRRFLLGISSVNRKQNYLLDTLTNFFDALEDAEKQSITVVVFNANIPASGHGDIAKVRSRFAKLIDTGTLVIIQRPDDAQPHPRMTDPSTLTIRWGDDLARVIWRSKQTLDVAYLMRYAVEHRAGHEYFVMMEDDIIASRNFAKKIRNYVDNALYSRTDWTMASFYNPWEDVRDGELLPPYKFFGVIGQLFRMHDMPVLVEFLEKNFDQSPLDWLFVDFLKKFNGRLIQHSPSYFQHQGRVSSFPGKEQGGRSVDFQP